MKPAIELLKLEAESLICESPSLTGDPQGTADPELPIGIKDKFDATPEDVLGLPEALKLW